MFIKQMFIDNTCGTVFARLLEDCYIMKDPFSTSGGLITVGGTCCQCGSVICMSNVSTQFCYIIIMFLFALSFLFSMDHMTLTVALTESGWMLSQQ